MNKGMATIALVVALLCSSAIVESRPVWNPDFDGDGTVGFSDFVQFAGKFGSRHGDETYEDRFDLDGDGAIAFSDFLIFTGHFGKTVPRTVEMMINFPLRAISASGNWGDTGYFVDKWNAAGRVGALIPPDYIEWLISLHVNWVGLVVSLYYNDSMDSTVERVYSSDVNIPTFSDEALRQLIREFRNHGIDVYLTLALQTSRAAPARPVQHWQLGDPAPPHTGGVPPDDPNVFGLILPKNWPWRADHPDHEGFVAEFWETYTQQAVHFAGIAEEEGVRLCSLGTETDRLFRTRPGGYMTNDFGRELRSMVQSVRVVYSGLLTYDMHYDVLESPDFYGPGSGAGHLWEDLDLDVVGISAWFPLTDSRTSTVLSVERFQASYRQIFQDWLMPLANRNPYRPIVFLEYGAMDVVETPERPGDTSAQNRQFEFTDSNGNGLDDGREQQANIYQALINTMAEYPGIVNGVFFWDNYISSDEQWAAYWAGRRCYGIWDKLAEEVVRSAYASYAESSGSD